MAIHQLKIIKTPPPAVYATLLSKVKKTLVEGQARIEGERLRTYWETGKIVDTHIVQYSGGNAKYGDEIVIRLSRDLAVSETVLYRCLKFNQTYPDIQKVAGRPLFRWSHYRKLMTIRNGQKRRLFEQAALKNAWTSDELALRIKEKEAPGESSGVSTSSQFLANRKPLVPLRGTLYTYRLIERPCLSVGVESGLLVDLGFGVYHETGGGPLSGFVKDDIVESRPKNDAYKFYKTERTAKDLFTYAAFVEKVIDGDTLKVRLDLGFNIWIRQILRLRDIDCPELGTPEGEEIKAFVRSHLKETQRIVVRSSRSDKYDRYLADVFIPRSGEYVEPTGEEPSAEKDVNPERLVVSEVEPSRRVYLNNLLLESGRAVRMK